MRLKLQTMIIVMTCTLELLLQIASNTLCIMSSFLYIQTFATGYVFILAPPTGRAVLCFYILNCAILLTIGMTVALALVITSPAVFTLHVIVVVAWSVFHTITALNLQTTLQQNHLDAGMALVDVDVWTNRRAHILAMLRDMGAHPSRDTRAAAAPYTSICGACYAAEFAHKTVCPICLQTFAFCKQGAEDMDDERSLSLAEAAEASSVGRAQGERTDTKRASGASSHPPPTAARTAVTPMATVATMAAMAPVATTRTTTGMTCSVVCYFGDDKSSRHTIEEGHVQSECLPMCLCCRTFFHPACLLSVVEQSSSNCPSCRTSFLQTDTSLVRVEIVAANHTVDGDRGMNATQQITTTLPTRTTTMEVLPMTPTTRVP
jgi:hypothetical protein